ncbi:MAG: hypothetical protein ACOYOZ_10985, partial [Pirellula sp.]
SRAAVHRLAADGYDSQRMVRVPGPVATCRQTVEAFSRRCPPLGSGWLRFAADGSRSRGIEQPNREPPK